MRLKPMNKNFRSNGFVRIEFLILICIIIVAGITLWSSYAAARAQARDEQRVIDVHLMQKALDVYFTNNGFYPYGNGIGMPQTMIDYLEPLPMPPSADGNCTDAQNSYTYSQKSNGLDYLLTFCLGSKTDGLSAGIHSVNSKEIK